MTLAQCSASRVACNDYQHHQRVLQQRLLKPGPDAVAGKRPHRLCFLRLVYGVCHALGLPRQKGIDSRLHILAQIHVEKTVVVYVVVAFPEGHEVVVGRTYFADNQLTVLTLRIGDTGFDITQGPEGYAA